MPQIKIEQKHSKSQEEAKKALIEVFAEDLDEFDIAAEWKDYVCELKGKGAHGAFIIDKDKVTFDFSMSILARSGGIDPQLLEDEVRKRMQQALS